LVTTLSSYTISLKEVMQMYHKEILTSLEKHIGKQELLIKRKLVAEILEKPTFNRLGLQHTHHRCYNELRTHFLELPIDFSYVFEVQTLSVIFNTIVFTCDTNLEFSTYKLCAGLDGLSQGVLVANQVAVEKCYFEDPNVSYKNHFLQRIGLWKKPVITNMKLVTYDELQPILFYIPIRILITTQLKDSVITV
jgi:hypothetical protein